MAQMIKTAINKVRQNPFTTAFYFACPGLKMLISMFWPLDLLGSPDSTLGF
jgi:hypothetical protein